ncbi:hypothetical protein [Kitasatospora sp. NPDC091207]|uniref:hypothetical protein n=1 Tax=Kitasatospora sp. NPDC091207 TaxID=3364083 RepID=UPI00382545AA
MERMRGGMRRLVGGVLVGVLVALCATPASAVPESRDVPWDQTPRPVADLPAGDRYLVQPACGNWALAGWPTTGGYTWRSTPVGTWTGVWYRGGAVFSGFRETGTPLLDGWPGLFHEYDVKAYTKIPDPRDRGQARLVRATADGQAPITWYSPDHYVKFQRLSDCG